MSDETSGPPTGPEPPEPPGGPEPPRSEPPRSEPPSETAASAGAESREQLELWARERRTHSRGEHTLAGVVAFIAFFVVLAAGFARPVILVLILIVPLIASRGGPLGRTAAKGWLIALGVLLAAFGACLAILYSR